MNQGTTVECISPCEPYLIKGNYYTIKNITNKGNYLLYEVDPPSPHTSFNKDRFREADIPPIETIIEELINECVYVS